MKTSWIVWLANYAAGIVAALSLGLVALLIVAWVNVLPRTLSSERCSPSSVLLSLRC